MLSQAAETSQNQQPGRIECSAIRRGKWVQMEELAQRIRRLARDLRSDKPLGEKRRFGTSISAVAVTGNYSNPSKCDKFGFTCIKVHPDGMGALKKTGRNPLEEHGADGTPNFIWSPHLIGMGESFRCLRETVATVQKVVPFCNSSVRWTIRFTS